MGGLIGHSTGRRSLSTVGGTHVCPPQSWREIDARDFCSIKLWFCNVRYRSGVQGDETVKKLKMHFKSCACFYVLRQLLDNVGSFEQRQKSSRPFDELTMSIRDSAQRWSRSSLQTVLVRVRRLRWRVFCRAFGAQLSRSSWHSDTRMTVCDCLECRRRCVRACVRSACVLYKCAVSSALTLCVGLHYFDLLWICRARCCCNKLYDKSTTNRIAYPMLHCFDLLTNRKPTASPQQVEEQTTSLTTSWTTCRTATPQQIRIKLHATIIHHSFIIHSFL